MPESGSIANQQHISHSVAFSFPHSSGLVPGDCRPGSTWLLVSSHLPVTEDGQQISRAHSTSLMQINCGDFYVKKYSSFILLGCFDNYIKTYKCCNDIYLYFIQIFFVFICPPILLVVTVRCHHKMKSLSTSL